MAFAVHDSTGQLTVVLRLPRPNEIGVYDIEGVYKAVIMEGLPSADHPAHPNKMGSIWVRSPDEILKDMIRNALDVALVSAVHGNPPAEQVGQDLIDKWFATSELVRQVDPDKPLDMELTRDTIHIVIDASSLDTEDRRIHDWPGVVDPLTTPQGSRALQTFRLAEGTRVDKGRFTRSDKIMCRTMNRCLVFPENTNPTRLLITRSAFAKHEEMVYHEDPMVAHVNYEPRSLRGTHMLTAIMAGKYNYSDCVQISQSAAQRLSCYRRLNQSIVDTHPIQVLVKEGDEVEPDDIVMLVEGGATDNDGNPATRVVRTRNLYTKAIVAKVQRRETHILGEPAERVRIKYESVYAMQDGDKLTTRHGNKGAVRVIPDRDMPKLADGRVVEVLVHPFSFISRRPLGTLREMMCNLLCQNTNVKLRTQHFSPAYDMESMVKAGWGKKQDVWIGSWKLPYQTFVAPLYWLRLDMHAREQLSACGSVKPKNFHGLNPDAGKVSGQRINMGTATVLHAKGLVELHKILHVDNLERGAIRMVEDYLSVLAFKGQFVRNRKTGKVSVVG